MKKLPPSTTKASAFQSSPFKNITQINTNKQSNASKDLDSYLRKSNESLKNQYNFKEVDQFESQDEKPISLKRQSRQKQVSDIKNQERSTSSVARLQDLCPEDKAKIGELVKKLALESKQKQEVSQKYEQEKLQLTKRMKELEQQTQSFESEREKMKDKFTQSLQMLKELKEQHFKLDEEKSKQKEELEQVKMELIRREEELQKQKELEKSYERQFIDMQPVREQTKHTIQESSQISQINNDQTINTLKEITDLKNEIMKLTTSLRSLKNSPESKQHSKSPKRKEQNIFKDTKFSAKIKNIEQERENKQQQQQQEDEDAWWETHSKIQKRKQQSNKSSQERIQTNRSLITSRVEDLKTMKLEDLHELQEELAKKLEITNSLLQSKLTNSANKKDNFYQPSFTLKMKNLDENKMSKLLEKAENEYEDYFSSSPTPRPSHKVPEPESLSKKDENLAKKMEMFKQIQQRFKPQPNETPSFQENERPEKDTTQSIGNSYYKSLIQQQTQILQRQKQGKPPIPNFQNQSVKEEQLANQDQESDDDLIYSLNQRSNGPQQQQQVNHYQSCQQPKIELLQPNYDDSLFTIIDEIEQDQLNQSQYSENSKVTQSNSKRPNSYFQQQLNGYNINSEQKQNGYHQQQNTQPIRQSMDYNPVNQSNLSSQVVNSSYKNNPYYQKAKQEVDQYYSGKETKLSQMMKDITKEQSITQLGGELGKLNFKYDNIENYNPSQLSQQYSINSRRHVTFNM